MKQTCLHGSTVPDINLCYLQIAVSWQLQDQAAFLNVCSSLPSFAKCFSFCCDLQSCYPCRRTVSSCCGWQILSCCGWHCWDCYLSSRMGNSSICFSSNVHPNLFCVMELMHASHVPNVINERRS